MRKSMVRSFTILFWVSLAATIQSGVAAEREKKTDPAAEPWHQLLQRNPYPYTTPLPPATPTAVDGIYVKFETKATPPTPCRRCPDYKPEGGWWKLGLDKGVFRIWHTATGWKTLGTFLVIGDRILLANDPVCPALTGVYRWKATDTGINFCAIEDRCSAGLRAKNLSGIPWQSCPARSHATGGGMPLFEPDGCDRRR